MSRRALVDDRWPCSCRPVWSTRWALHGPSCHLPAKRRRPLRRLSRTAPAPPTATSPMEARS
jgi:hypothetical protein